MPINFDLRNLHNVSEHWYAQALNSEDKSTYVEEKFPLLSYPSAPSLPQRGGNANISERSL